MAGGRVNWSRVSNPDRAFLAWRAGPNFQKQVGDHKMKKVVFILAATFSQIRTYFFKV